MMAKLYKSFSTEAKEDPFKVGLLNSCCFCSAQFISSVLYAFDYLTTTDPNHVPCTSLLKRNQSEYL